MSTRNEAPPFWLRVLLTAALALLLAGYVLICSVGCGTVTPKAVQTEQASFDGDAQNSGIVGPAVGGGFVITTHARDRYNALIEVYGRDFAPPLRKDDGVRGLGDGTFVMDHEHLEKFIEMNRWRKSGFAPR